MCITLCSGQNLDVDKKMAVRTNIVCPKLIWNDLLPFKANWSSVTVVKPSNLF